MTRCIYKSTYTGMCVHREMLKETDGKMVPCVLTPNSKTTNSVVVCKLEQGPREVLT